MRVQQGLCAALSLTCISLGHVAAAKEINHVLKGSFTETTAQGTQTVPDQLTLTTHQDDHGKFRPEFETTEVIGGQTKITTYFTNPVPLPNDEGYSFEMSGSENGSAVEKLGKFVALGEPGAFTSFQFEKDAVIGSTSLFQTGKGTIVYAATGDTMTREESIVTATGTVVEAVHAVDTGK